MRPTPPEHCGSLRRLAGSGIHFGHRGFFLLGVWSEPGTFPKHEGLMLAPLSPYAVSKMATEQYAMAWQHSYGQRSLAFRFFNVFGPRQAPGHAYAAVIPAFVHAALTGDSAHSAR
jgi:nucleoside-diphosphate-sugar epimerase